MGNNGSSSHQHCASNGLPETNRGWTQSFPRELTRHHSQPAARKVLPEPPNQRLRATNNGSIIHNGGTISGRRPPALTLPHELSKQGVFRGRSKSTTASNIAERSRKIERPCCRYQGDPRLENGSGDLKKFGSEPDLRYSPENNPDRLGDRYGPKQNGYADGAYREARERQSRYKGRKKYKAPAPPAAPAGEGSSPDSSGKWDTQREPEEDLQPPPRRCRLFKTRAETKKAQVDRRFSANAATLDRRVDERAPRPERPGDRWQEREPAERNRRNEHKRPRSKLFESGKNTLQRSMSSPEFQAELIQVARKVRDKLHCEAPGKFRSLDRCSDGATKNRTAEKPAQGSKPRQNPERGGPGSRGGISEAEDQIVPRVREEKRVDRRRKEKSARGAYSDYPEFPANEDREDDREGQPDGMSEGKSRAILGRSSNSEEDERKRSDERDICPIRKPLREVVGREERLAGDKRKTEYSSDLDLAMRAKSNPKHREREPANGTSMPKSPVARFVRDKFQIRGWPSGRASGEEHVEQRGGDKENSDPRRWKSGEYRNSRSVAEKKREHVLPEKIEAKLKDEFQGETKVQEDEWCAYNPLSSPEKSTPKTFYFGMNDTLSTEARPNCVDRVEHAGQTQPELRDDGGPLGCALDDADVKHVTEDISLKLRPTLPKKQLEIPRFSPSAAWRLLSALETPGPTMSTASEEMPVMFEERIERLSRPPPPLLALGPRSLHDKSGDSGISGDAGAPIDDSLDVGPSNRTKTPAARPTWTPQQDLGEESSSDAGLDSPPPMPPMPSLPSMPTMSLKYPPRAHVFSLSLPRDENRASYSLFSSEAKSKEGSSAFNSLQKLKRSVSGALGLGPLDLERKCTRDVLDDNWMLSSSAPTSLQHNHLELASPSPPNWRPSFDESPGNLRRELDDENNGDVSEEDVEENLEGKSDFPVLLKPPSFSYLASAGHVMYLPESNSAEYQAQSLNGRKVGPADGKSMYKKYGVNEINSPRSRSSCCLGALEDAGRPGRGSKSGETKFKVVNKRSGLSKSCENISEMKQRSSSPSSDLQTSMSSKPVSAKADAKETKTQPKRDSKGKRFTFQSTVRQIERRRIAEKLSREAEAKERQRKGELEAMRKVEEEFQRKRAREKANIRQQLRLYSMEENMSSLPAVWDSSQLSRADPDGAPSSTASSPTSVPPSKLPTMPRKTSVSSDEFHRKRAPGSESRLHQRENKSYRPKYYDWAPDATTHFEFKQTTVHPKIVCDIPKSSPVFLDANVHGKSANSNSTPRSDNYRKDFAHGALAAKSSLASSDSELSQPNTRPHSRQTGSKSKPQRSRSASPERSEDAAGSGSSEEETPVEPIKRERNISHDFVLNGVQPFVREKTYRPISFNPQTAAAIPS